MSTQEKLIKEILADLKSIDDGVVMEALKRVKSKGDASVIPAMLALYGTSKNEEVTAEIKTLLSQLRLKDGVPALIKGLESGTDEVNEMILFSLWNANLNPVDYIPEIIAASCKGSYMVALEGLTVIENLDGPFKEEILNDAKIVLNEYFNREDEKVDLIKSILGLVRSFDNTISG